jgi:hypothetical protein
MKGAISGNPERDRLELADAKLGHWRKWGPYLSDRQWGTVREDYSADGDAWSYFPFDHARSRAYRWGEDGLFGISDNHQRLCLALALWNGNDAILKERLFGLSGHEGNHAEDVKELYFYSDNVPTHAYMRATYKYPHAAFPYEALRAVNAARTRTDPEFELLDTGIFAERNYFDVTVEYAKAGIDDILARYTVSNRGATRAVLHVLPTLWFRNEWSWVAGNAKPRIRGDVHGGHDVFETWHPTLGQYHLACENGAQATYFTENETNFERLFGVGCEGPYTKDGIGERVVAGDLDAVNPANEGTKAAAHYVFDLAPGESRVVRVRLSDGRVGGNPFDAAFDEIVERRRAEADRFYECSMPFPASDDERAVQRQAFAGMLWSKQFYNYVVRTWIDGDPLEPPPPTIRKTGRNANWRHFYADVILSMPDTWEYPWFAAWDLAFHVIPLAMIDPTFAKGQIVVLTREWFMHPNGQLPAYEWAFDDVNPPVHAWAAYRVYEIEEKMFGRTDMQFLERVFQKLLLNFTWWVNRKDRSGNNVFQGGFLGLDNISVFDRSMTLPGGAQLEQADGTAWMGVYSLNMLAIALDLARMNSVYEDIASKFFEHFLAIAKAINAHRNDGGLWNATDGFYYDQLYLANGERRELSVRSIVGLIPLFAIEALLPEALDDLPGFRSRLEWFVKNRPDYAENVAPIDTGKYKGRRLLAIVDPVKLRRILAVVFDENEFLSPHGVRALSRRHADRPFVLDVDGMTFRVDYEPAESTSGLFGGNSNWRGPVWFPINYLLIESLQRFHFILGDEFTVEYPTGSGTHLTLWEVASDLSKRLISLFTRDASGARTAHGAETIYRDDPYFRDHVLFYEYFHGDNGAGIGASHQTGWTGLVAKLIQQQAEYRSRSPLDWHDFTMSRE